MIGRLMMLCIDVRCLNCGDFDFEWLFVGLFMNNIILAVMTALFCVMT